VSPLACSLAGREESVRLLPGSRAAAIYGTDRVAEDFFCSYGLNPAYRPAIEQAGLRVTGLSDDGEAMIVELDQHPFFVATLFCFQTRSRPERPHPLAAAFAAACAGPS
jgi:CTP synthase (UTP-ammonia lyase)